MLSGHEINYWPVYTYVRGEISWSLKKQSVVKTSRSEAKKLKLEAPDQVEFFFAECSELCGVPASREASYEG